MFGSNKDADAVLLIGSPRKLTNGTGLLEPAQHLPCVAVKTTSLYGKSRATGRT